MITEMTFHERSLLFANLASIAYNDDIEQVKKLVRKLGFTTVEFYNKDGAQAYRFMNKIDLVIACRGTQPTEFNDISADLKAMPVVAETVSRVHRGFKAEVDELWPMISEDLARKTNRDKEVWFCGHSLGAAMATIMASRCALNYDFPEVDCLFTYGSPRVGWPNYVKSLKICHYRWQNNNDIVTRVPLRLMNYKHDGTRMYIGHDGTVHHPVKINGLSLFKDRMKGMWGGIKQLKVDNFSDHAMTEYVKHIENW